MPSPPGSPRVPTPPLILGVDLRADVVQALRDDLGRRQRLGVVMLVTACRWAPSEPPTAAGLAAAAARAWGVRVARGLAELDLLGPRLRFTGRGGAEARILAAVLRTGPRRGDELPPLIAVPLGPVATSTVRILLQRDAQDRVHLALETARHGLLRQGAGLAWTTEFIRPGRAPGMLEEGVQDLLLHTLTLSGPALDSHADVLCRAAEQCAQDASGALVSAWTPEDLNGAVLFPVPHGALPLLVHRTRRLGGGLQVRPMLAGGALYLGGLDEARVAATEDALGLARWTPSRVEPARLFTALEGVGPGRLACSLSWAAAGHYANWFVEADPRLTPSGLAAALRPLVGDVLAVLEADGLDPETGRYSPVFHIRVGPQAVDRARQLAHAAAPLRVLGVNVVLLPCTATRPRRRVAPQGPPGLLPTHQALLDQGPTPGTTATRTRCLPGGMPVEPTGWW